MAIVVQTKKKEKKHASVRHAADNMLDSRQFLIKLKTIFKAGTSKKTSGGKPASEWPRTLTLMPCGSEQVFLYTFIMLVSIIVNHGDPCKT